MAKTPVSILQEMSAQLKIAPPHYDLIHNRPEGVNPEFKFQVTFNGVVAVGGGRSKKEARHNAAEMAITKLTSQQKVERQLLVTSVLRSNGESVASPFNNQVTRNYVGELAELCASNQLPAPLYNEVRAEGPSHAPSFTLSCSVSQMIEIAQASTKKQAKHCVAKKMLARIEECLLTENFKKSARVATIADMQAEKDEDEQVKAMVIKVLSQQLILPTITNSRPVAELHLAVEDKYGAVPPKSLIDAQQDSLDWNPYVQVQKLAEEMGVSCYVNIRMADNSAEEISYYLYVSDADKESAATEIKCTTDKNTEECISNGAEHFVKLFLVTSPLSVVVGHSQNLRAAKSNAAEKMIAHLKRMALKLVH